MADDLLPCACTVAGSDSGGGAGIQADVKTFHSLGVWGLSVITAITAQNSREVRGAVVTDPEMIGLQLRTLREDFDIRAIKTGMLGDARAVRATAEALPEDVPLIVDPVMVSTGGDPLLSEDAAGVMVQRLFPRATVVTPNIPEALALTGRDRIETPEDVKEAAYEILQTGPRYVLIKGGHLGSGDDVCDLLVGKGGEWTETGTRYPYTVHGSGCCFSAALTAYLALDDPVPQAFRKARIFIDEAIRDAVKSRSGVYMVNP
ncbi:MAG TPA: bifunctional hydroxymethylpyrimidine kinase/phosphomethylpyrimidine kinase [Methanoregulaceae archaeon]|jgi:hydroxymethylpyrimidine/phosphomethylpyrimidine kinase|nr:bifunctional hydroxymethylpyrimidine kinase/phosphomethylpyrimidine kinase [Methanoregulaceae archaeon]HRX33021.1 bifunctional hydroxymethylpyrimidine kinase/phosphomethylpyrimidine kinase [Methanoregulaceae archaeon]